MMKPIAQAVVLTNLASELRLRDSWCGETHLQKSAYLLQELEGVPLEFDFILYKHGPFSFDLRDRLTELRADGFLHLAARPYPYGPTFIPSELAKRTWKNFPITLGKYKTQIARVASLVGDKGVTELERLATALYVTRELGNEASRGDRAERMMELKPHISESDAIAAIALIDREIKNRRR
jgi:uncharacterized protein YwgA